MAEKDEKKPYTYTAYDPTKSTAYTSANEQATNTANAWTTHNTNGYTWGGQGEYDTLRGNYADYLNKGFSYDFNADALYQQYKDKYIQQGKMAMQDTMGQAAALTGGYGNSYASTVGNQAYQASLQNLNDVIPQLYQMAYSMHQDKGQNMLNQLGLLESDRAFDYGQWVDKGNMLYNNMNYWQTEANNIYDREFTAHNTNESMLYQAAQDAIEQERWQAEHALNDRQVALAENQFKYQTGEYTPKDANGTPIVNNSGNGGNGGNGGNTTTTGGNKNLDEITKQVQKYSTKQGQADYLADMVNADKIDDVEAARLLNEYGVVDLVDRSWEMVDDGGINWFGIGIDADAKVSDGNKTYTLAELRKELTKTMTTKEANDWIKKLQKKLGI